MSSKEHRIEQLEQQLLNTNDLPLLTYRQEHNYQPVLGEGNVHAKIVFIGEAPGKSEAETGRPFVGAAGKLLDELLDNIGISRGDIFITNIVNDRPPNNRDPLPDEIALYSPFLIKLLQIIQPPIIATLGRFSARFMLETCHLPQATQPMGKLHGQIFSCHVSYGIVKLIPLYHPAAALYQATLKETLAEDMIVLRKLYEEVS